MRDWPIKTQPAEAAIWLLGSGEGIKRQLAQISLGKEITVGSLRLNNKKNSNILLLRKLDFDLGYLTSYTSGI